MSNVTGIREGRKAMKALRNLNVPDEEGFRGLSKILGPRKVKVTVDYAELVTACTRNVHLTTIPAQLEQLGYSVADVIPTHEDFERTKDGIVITLAVCPGAPAAADNARWTSLSTRIKETSRFLGIVTALVTEYRADGHGFMSSECASRLGLDNMFQVTGYVVGNASDKDVTLNYAGGVVKGMLVCGIDHPDLRARKVLLKSGKTVGGIDADIVINANMIKGLSVPVGTKVRVALYEQDKAHESHTLIDIALAMQFMTRACELFTDEAWEYFTDYARRMFPGYLDIHHGLGDETGPTQVLLSRIMELGIPVRNNDLMPRFIAAANRHYKFRIPGLQLRLITNPSVPEGCVSLPARARRWYKRGQVVTCFRYPFMGINIGNFEVIDFKGHGFHDGSVFTGDSDGDMVVVLKMRIIDEAKLTARLNRFSDLVPVLEVGKTDKKRDGLGASLCAVLSKMAIGIEDTILSDHVYKARGMFNAAWACQMRQSQDVVDFVKKDIPGIQFGGSSKVDPVYRELYTALNGKIETKNGFYKWNEALTKGRALYGTVQGPLGRLLDLYLGNIDLPKFRKELRKGERATDDYIKQYYQRPAVLRTDDVLYVWHRELMDLSPREVAIMRRIGQRYKRLSNWLTNPAYNGEKEFMRKAAMKYLHQMMGKLNRQKYCKMICDHICMNILLENPLRIPGLDNPRIMAFLPTDGDVIRYYHHITGFRADYGYRLIERPEIGGGRAIRIAIKKRDVLEYFPLLKSMVELYRETLIICTKQQELAAACGQLGIKCEFHRTRGEFKTIDKFI